jgi:hypothetical protein
MTERNWQEIISRFEEQVGCDAHDLWEDDSGSPSTTRIYDQHAISTGRFATVETSAYSLERFGVGGLVTLRVFEDRKLRQVCTVDVACIIGGYEQLSQGGTYHVRDYETRYFFVDSGVLDMEVSPNIVVTVGTYRSQLDYDEQDPYDVWPVDLTLAEFLYVYHRVKNIANYEPPEED